MASRIADIARDDDGLPVSGANVSLRRESDNFEIASTVTDADGYFSLSETAVGYPGPTKIVVTDVSGNVRQHSGRATGQVGTIFMADLARAFLMMTDGVTAGVANELVVTSTGLTMNVSVGAGECFVFGHPRTFAAPTTVAIAANGSGNPRLDLIVVRLIPPGVAGEGKTTIEVIQGTPAASPVAPGVTQDPNVKWELALATVRVEPGVSSIASGKLTDVRIYTSGPLQNNSVSTAKLADNAVTTPKLADANVTLAKLTAGGTVSTSDTAQLFKAPTSGTTPVIATLSTKELSDFSSDAATAGQAAIWDAATSQYKPTNLPATTKPIIKEGGATKVASADTFNFDAGDFDVVESPAGTGTVTLAADSITAVEIAAAAVGNTELSNGSVDSAKLAVDAVLTTRIANAQVTDAKIATGIDAIKIGGGLVDNTEFSYLNGVTSSIQGQFTSLTSSVSSNTTAIAGKASTTHTHLLTDPSFDQAIAGYTSHSIGTTITTVANKNTPVLANGKRYFVYARADGQANAPTAGFIQMYVRIEAGGTNTPGTTQGTVGGERSIWAQDAKIVVGTGAVINVAARAGTDTGTGSITDASVHFIIIPLDVPAS